MKTKPASGGDKASNKGREIDQKLVLSATSLARSKSETNEQFLSRVTHLHLQNKRITKILGLESCTNLKVLYLYDNSIQIVENLEFAKILSYVYLQNNEIESIPALENPALKKIYLDENKIEFVTGLEQCAALEELFMARQRLPPFTSMEFDINSLRAVAQTLEVIDVSGNGVMSLAPLKCLYNLRRVFAQDNNVSSMKEIEDVISLPRVEEANFTNNPCAKARRYRDCAIAASSDLLQLLDEVPVLKHQQIAYRGLHRHRQKIGAAFPVGRGSGNADEMAAQALAQGSLFGEEGPIEGEAVVQEYSKEDDIAFGSIPPAETEGKEESLVDAQKSVIEAPLASGSVVIGSEQ